MPGKCYTKLDFQVPLDEHSKKFLIVNTQKGLFRYTRLPYGISFTPGIFQQLMESFLQGIPNVIVYLDDILVTGSSDEEHLQTLSCVFDRLERASPKVKMQVHDSLCVVLWLSSWTPPSAGEGDGCERSA